MSKINIDITRWKTALPTTTEDKETFFHDALARGAESDFGSYFSKSDSSYTISFNLIDVWTTLKELCLEAFLDDLPLMEGELRTYAQLLFHQKLVFNTLLKHLLIKGNTSLPTLLEWVSWYFCSWWVQIVLFPVMSLVLDSFIDFFSWFFARYFWKGCFLKNDIKKSFFFLEFLLEWVFFFRNICKDSDFNVYFCSRIIFILHFL